MLVFARASVCKTLAARGAFGGFSAGHGHAAILSTLEQSHDSPVAAHRHLEHNWYASRRAITISPAAENAQS